MVKVTKNFIPHCFRYVSVSLTFLVLKCHKIPKISPRAYVFQRLSLRGLCTEGNLHFKIDGASLILGRKFTVILCFTLYLRAISKYKPLGGLYLEGWFNWEFFALRVWVWGLVFEGLLQGGAYFRNFTVILILNMWVKENYVDFKWVVMFCFPVSTELCKNQGISCTRR